MGEKMTNLVLIAAPKHTAFYYHISYNSVVGNNMLLPTTQPQRSKAYCNLCGNRRRHQPLIQELSVVGNSLLLPTTPPQYGTYDGKLLNEWLMIQR